MNIREQINDISLDNCEEIQIGDAMYFLLSKIKTKYSLVSSIQTIMLIICCWITSDITFQHKGDASSLFLFSNSYGSREDYKNSFVSCYDIVQNATLVMPAKRRMLRKPRFKDLFVINSWNKKIKPIFKSVSQRLVFLYNLYEAFVDYYLCDEYAKKNSIEYKNLISLCDAHFIDSYFTQKFNHLNKNTVTLQHGVFATNINSWMITGSYSKYMLVNSEYTIRIGKQLDYNNKMIPVGLLSFINKKDSYKKIPKRIDCIGVFLDGDIVREDNFRSIEIVGNYCNKYGKKLRLKFHPISELKTYESILQNFPDAECYGKEISALDFCDLIDVAVVRNSTTLLESLQMNVPTFIIYDEYQKVNVYEDVNILKFESADDLNIYIGDESVANLPEIIDKARSYFCANGNITDNYKKAFEGIDVI